jgi:uncharacterized membrane protein YhhN
MAVMRAIARTAARDIGEAIFARMVNLLRLLLLAFFIAELFGEWTHDSTVVFFTKPVVLPLIALLFHLSSKGREMGWRATMMLAFLFSWFGDVFLMLTPETLQDLEVMGIAKNPNFFLGGLGSFLVAQLLFISSYRKAVWNDRPTVQQLWWFVPFGVFWLMMMAFILPPIQAHPEKHMATVPVAVYSAILTSMAAFALARWGRTGAASFWAAFLGAFIFVVSDTLIAINFLVLPEPTHLAGFTIFITYGIAEYLIAEGMLRHE